MMEADNKIKCIKVFSKSREIKISDVNAIITDYIDGHFTILDKEDRVLASFQSDEYSFAKLYEKCK